MREFIEDYGEFVALFIVILPAVLMFIRLGIRIGQINFGG